MTNPQLDEFGDLLLDTFDGRVEERPARWMPSGAKASLCLVFPSMHAQAELYDFASWDDAQQAALAIRATAPEDEILEVATNGRVLLVVDAPSDDPERQYAVYDLLSRFAGEE